MSSCLEEFLGDLVVVAGRGVARDEFAQEASEEQLGAQDHGGKRQVEVGRVGDQGVVVARIHIVELECAHNDDRNEAQEEH